MELSAMLVPNLTIGLDLGDKSSWVCELDAGGQVVACGAVGTTPASIEEYFSKRTPGRVVLEVGTHSPWVSRLLESLGHQVIVANPSAVYGKRRRKRRNDSMDAEFLARQGRADPKLLHPIRHRGADAQRHLSMLRARDTLVSSRTKLINHVRGSVKAMGGRIGRCSAEAFARKAHAKIPLELQPVMEPLLETVGELTKRISSFDRQITAVVDQSYPEARLLQQIRGVGAVTALAYVLLIEDPRRFQRSRDVGAYFGLVPRLDESSESTPQLRITKTGDKLGRRLLVSAANYILGPFGTDCDLRRHGELIAARGGKNARKRAKVAVARKLAVMMHRLWIQGEAYDPNYQIKRRAA